MPSAQAKGEFTERAARTSLVMSGYALVFFVCALPGSGALLFSSLLPYFSEAENKRDEGRRRMMGVDYLNAV